MTVPRPARSVPRTALVNLGIAVALVLGLLAATSLAADVYRSGKWIVRQLAPPETNERALLPNYPDREHALQIYADQDKLIEDYAPFIEWRQQPVHTKTINIDENGYRQHSVGRSNAAGALAIGFFGGSSMWGYGVDDDSTIPAHFDELTSGYDVTNYGELGYDSRQSLALLISLVNRNIAPKIVVFYDGYNDIWVHCNLAVTRGFNGHHEERKMRPLLQRLKESSYTYGNLVKPTVDFFRGLGGKEKPKDDFACDHDGERADRVAETLIRNWEIAAELVAGYGGRFLAFLQPVAFIGRPKIDHIEASKELARQLRDDLAAQYKAVYPILRTKLATRKLEWASDLTDSFDRDEHIYIDSVHVSSNGYEVIAERMRDRIAQH